MATQYDVVIIGAGPAGLTAALYTARRSLRTLVLSKDIGGQAATTTVIENYPGVGVIDGFELMQRFKEQAEQYGAKIVLAEVDDIQKVTATEFSITYQGTTVTTTTVILAFGLTPRSLNVPGEQHCIGHGVTYSTAAALDTMHDKIAIVVGGGNSAIESVNLLADVAKKVYLVHRRDRFRAEEVLVRKMEQHDNVEQILNAQVVEIQGDNNVTGVVIEQQSQQRELAVDGVFINVGFMSKIDFVKDLVELTDHKEIIVQPDCTTGTPGMFAAGDITTVNYKQVVVSAGEGCKAALACYAYAMKLAGKPVEIDQDWAVTSGAEHFIRT